MSNKRFIECLFCLVFIQLCFNLKAQDLYTLCGGSKGIKYQVTGGPGSVFHWTVEGGQIVSDPHGNTIAVNWENQQGEYMITAFEETTTGCKGNSMKAKIRIISSPAINLGKFKTICKGDQMELDPGKGYSRYLWHNGSTNPSFITDTAGTYWVEVTNQNECTIRDSIEIMVIPLPKINLGNDTMLCATNELLLDAGDKGTFYKWSNGVTSQTIIAHEGDGQIWVKVSDANGCVGTDTIQILHCSKQQKLEIANAFTPNGDGHNDYWQIEGYQNYPDMTVKVFDRWGIEVFSSEHGYFKPWDGTIGGKNLPTGAYYYIIKLGDGSKEITGSLTLIR